jgi:hypothetical protein
MGSQITPEVINKLSLEEGEERLLAGVESETPKSPVKRELGVLEIHPIFRQGMFPMSGPVGIGINGELIRAKALKVEVPEEIINNDPTLGLYNLPLIWFCTCVAKAEGWKYFYMIVRDSGYFIRGC